MPLGFDDLNVIGLLRSRQEVRFEDHWLGDICYMNLNSNSADEEYGFFGGYAKMREWIGQRQAQTTAQKSVVIRNRKFEATCSVKRDLLRRDKTGLLQSYLDSWIDSVPIYHWEDLAIETLLTNGNCYDGTPLVGTSHRWAASQTAQSNQITSSDVAALDVTTPATPTPTEMAGVVMGMAAYMLGFKDDKDRYINGSARSFKVIVNTINHFTALTTALTSNLLTGIVDNPINGFSAAGFKFKPVFVPAYTGANKIRMFRTDGPVKPLIAQQEKEMQYEVKGEGSDYAFDNDAHAYGLNTNRGFGPGLWESILEGTLS